MELGGDPPTCVNDVAQLVPGELFPLFYHWFTSGGSTTPRVVDVGRVRPALSLPFTPQRTVMIDGPVGGEGEQREPSNGAVESSSSSSEEDSSHEDRETGEKMHECFVLTSVTKTSMYKWGQSGHRCAYKFTEALRAYTGNRSVDFAFLTQWRPKVRVREEADLFVIASELLV